MQIALLFKHRAGARPFTSLYSAAMIDLLPIVATLLLGAPDTAPTARPARKIRPAPRPRRVVRSRRVIHPRPAPPRPRAPVTRDAKKPQGWKWPSRIGPFRMVSQNGRNVLAIGFAGQVQAELRVTDVGGDEPGDTVMPKLRRIRLLLLGSFLTKHLKYYLQLSTAPKSLEIMDFFGEYRLHRHLRLRAGQYKIPFTRHREGSFKSLTFVDWSILVSAFGSERQLGVHIHNDGASPAGLYYAFGVFTGQNARRAHARLYARTWGESLPNPSDLTAPAPLDGFHPELVARLAYKTGGIDFKQDTDFKGGGLRLGLGLGLTWDLNPSVYLDQSLRGVAELLLKARFASLHAALYVATAREDARFSQRFAMLGGLVQASYLIQRRWELALRYAVVHFDQRLLDDARRRAGDLINAETDPVARAALESQYDQAGTIAREHEVTLGLNLYLVRNYLKVQLDVSWLGHERAAGLVHDVRSRLQLQLAF